MTRRMLVLLGLIALAVGCMPPTQSTVVIQADDDISMKASWASYMAARPNPKIVLRVPGYTKEITQTEMSQYESFYNFVEKRLLQAQFTVRDRSLLNEVLTRAGANLSYMEIRDKVDTDIMLEIVSYKAGLVSAMQFVDGSTAPPTPTTIQGVALEGRVIMVETGEVVGMFTLKEIHPYPDAYILTSTDPAQQAALQALTPQQRQTLSTQLQSGSEQMWNALARKLVEVLKGNPVQPSRLTKTLTTYRSSDW